VTSLDVLESARLLLSCAVDQSVMMTMMMMTPMTKLTKLTPPSLSGDKSGRAGVRPVIAIMRAGPVGDPVGLRPRKMMMITMMKKMTPE
jgi:hypothetical protein